MVPLQSQRLTLGGRSGRLLPGCNVDIGSRAMSLERGGGKNLIRCKQVHRSDRAFCCRYIGREQYDR